jgi:hypothetical protein
MSAERDRERKIRHEKIKKALAKKPSKSLQNRFGITPDSIKKINTPAKQRKELKKVIENNKRERPLKGAKSLIEKGMFLLKIQRQTYSKKEHGYFQKELTKTQKSMLTS